MDAKDLPIPKGSRRFQIMGDDLATLEREIPAIVDRIYPQIDNLMRVKLRQIQRILMDVRWNYGPPGECVIIPADSPVPDPKGE